jgi:Icc-related predicted phosphoesterase
MVKIVAISDTHCQHDSITIPDCDILIHAGDSTYRGTVGEISDFFKWFQSLNQAKHKIYVPGNHDHLAHKNTKLFNELIPSNVNVLIDRSIVLEGLKIHGSPWSPFFYDWSFNGLEERGYEGLGYEGGPGWNAKPDSEHPLLSEVFAKIEDDVNIVICHGPPRLGNLDRTPDGKAVGSNELIKRLVNLKELKAGFYGHIHEGYGCHVFNGVPHFNVASCNRDYKPVNPVTVFEL